jgi:hypothetical protein
MQRLCRLTVPGLSISRDFTAARGRLMAEFPNIEQVVATTAPETLVVLFCGAEDFDGWVTALLGPNPKPRQQRRQASKLLSLRRRRLPGDDFAA